MGEKERVAPKITEPGWEDYVLAELAPGERDRDGNPRAHGLQRLVEVFLGPIQSLRAKVVAATETYACVESTLIVRSKDGMQIFADVADTHPQNTPAPFCKHAAATAATKAKGRVCRLALRVSKVAAEEVGMVSTLETEKIPSPTINLMDNLCKQLNVSVMDFVNAGKQKYRRVEEIPFEPGMEMVELLSRWVNTRSNKEEPNIPEKVKGYKENWRK